MNDEILAMFRYLQKKRKPIKLMNVYKGLPVVSEVYILYTDTSEIIIKPESSQLVCLHNQRLTYIQDEVFPRTVQAQVRELDIQRGEAVLGGFSYTEPNIGLRQRDRVSPDIPVVCLLQSVNLEEMVSGQLVDLSQEGITVRIDQESLPHFIGEGNQVIVFIQLPSQQNGSPDSQPEPWSGSHPSTEVDSRFQAMERPINVPTTEDQVFSMPGTGASGVNEMGALGAVINIMPDANGGYRVGVQLPQRKAANELMRRFIVHRQAEIRRELKTIYDELFLKAG